MERGMSETERQSSSTECPLDIESSHSTSSELSHVSSHSQPRYAKQLNCISASRLKGDSMCPWNEIKHVAVPHTRVMGGGNGGGASLCGHFVTCPNLA